MNCGIHPLGKQFGRRYASMKETCTWPYDLDIEAGHSFNWDLLAYSDSSCSGTWRNGNYCNRAVDLANKAALIWGGNGTSSLLLLSFFHCSIMPASWKLYSLSEWSNPTTSRRSLVWLTMRSLNSCCCLSMRLWMRD